MSRQDYSNLGHANGAQSGDIEPLKSVDCLVLDGLPQETMDRLELVRQAYELDTLEETARVMVAQRIQQVLRVSVSKGRK